MQSKESSISVMIATIIALALFAITGCQSTAKVIHQTKAGTVDVYANADKRSALKNPRKSKPIINSMKQLLAKLKKDPGDVDSLTNLARLHLARGELRKATALVRAVLRTDYRSRDAKIILASIAYLQRSFDRASAILEGLGGIKARESEVLNLMALIALKDARAEDALTLLTAAVKKNPSDLSARMNLGVIMLQHQKVAAARTQFNEVLKRMPDHPDAGIHLAITYAMKGDHKKAQELYSNVEKSSGQSPILVFNKAVLQKRMKDYNGALKTLKVYVEEYAVSYAGTESALTLISDIRAEKAVSGTLSDSDIDDMIAKMEESKGSQRKIAEDDDETAPGYVVTNAGVIDAH